MHEQITRAASAADYQAFAGLVTEYVAWCRDRYHEHAWFVERVFGYQALDTELATLATAYGPPNGLTLLARREGVLCGGGAYRRLADGTCEMKRLFVPLAFAGHGTGRRLCQALMRHAAAEGFTRMRLDTAHLLREAIGLYHSLGFRDCPPYRSYPDELMPFLVFMDAPL